VARCFGEERQDGPLAGRQLVARTGHARRTLRGSCRYRQRRASTPPSAR
jgi:hypothetical protein